MTAFAKCQLCLYCDDWQRCPYGGQLSDPENRRCDKIIPRYGRRQFRDPPGDRDWQNPRRTVGQSNTRL